ncbi:sulfate ABC transporter substrate-binding protein, partial [Streptomyces sp. RSD-27]
MSAARSLTALRALAVTATLPLLLTACGYGSEAQKDEPKAAGASAGGGKLSASEVRIGYFPNLTHATALVGLQEGLIAKELGATAIKPQTFNA